MSTVLDIEKQKEYWREELRGVSQELPLSPDAVLPSGMDRELAVCSCPLEVDLRQARRVGLSYNLDAVFLACYLGFLHRMGNETDLLVGCASGEGRLLPLRIECSSGDSIAQLIGRISSKLTGALDNLPDAALIREILDNPLALPCTYGQPSQSAESLLHWSVYQNGEGWQLQAAYDRRSFRKETVLRFMDCYQAVVDAAVQDIHAAVGSIPITNAQDSLAYEALNRTYCPLPQELTVVDRFAAIAQTHSGHTALSSDGELVSYEELDCRSNQLARLLLANGLKRGGFVCIFMERSIETIISMLGVLKAGGAYIPLDPEHPQDRNGYIIADTASRFILTKSGLLPKVQALLAGAAASAEAFSQPAILQVDQELNAYGREPLPSVAEPDDLAYVIYTSGSTGKPKGALIAHKGVVNLAMAIKQDLGLTGEDILLQYSTFSFDASVYDIFGSLLNGCRLHLLGSEQRLSIDAFTEAVENTGATRISILPTVFFNQLAAYVSAEAAPKYRRIKSLVVGGEALAGEIVRQFQHKLGCDIRIVNAYGPTECTVAATTYTITRPVPEQVATICIGRPLANYEVYIVNPGNLLCPVGVTGELLISSVGVGKGYLNQPDKTAEAFIPDPVSPESGKTFYRSGDLARLTKDGFLEYMGRKDSQVKIRGYRIEIGEIEDNLAKHGALKDAAVIVAADAAGGKSLAAFYTTTSGAAVPKAELVRFLGSKVPAYMVPEHFQWLERMPVMPSGKIDRKALAALAIQPDAEPREGYAPPESPLEREVCAAWEKALHRSNIGIADNFFELGGHSLKVLEILAILKPGYPKLRINDFFQYPTVEQLASRIGYLQAEETACAGTEWTSPQTVRELAEHPAQFQGPIDRSRVYPQEHILLTGATGFLGSHLLYELLHRSKAVIYCLIRPHAHYPDPMTRLTEVMARYYGSGIGALLKDRAVIIEGDLEQEDLGLRPADRRLLEEQVDCIMHCAAEVKHFGDAEYFSRVNTASTERLLELARRNPQIRFHYISTLGIPEELALSGQWEAFTDSAAYPAEAYVENVYTQSKLEAERSVILACEKHGMPVTVYRVGNLCCRSDNGLFQSNIDNNAFYRMLKAMILLGVAPRAHCHVDITPVDYAGSAIAALAQRQGSLGGMFHICNPVQLSYEELVGYFQAYGYKIRFMELDEYEGWLLDAGAPKDEEGLKLAMAQLEGDGAKHSNWRFSCARTSPYLEEARIFCRKPDSELLEKLIKYAVSIGYFRRPVEAGSRG
ncbi:non-ribosomal peptide synthetase [Paenibacillus sp. YN15]|uniref:non-ribosomal peptide synthetase family protein n=1 Tax=Paenibacillus sp. YN15 TaxID=1742774 RepID=UPI000DCDC76A|nr:non-ribosomal peptide synthetase [Paenibacillus sp. YN15]RAV03458.1 thioester reductase [Paenibacillus sp. YN15]